MVDLMGQVNKAIKAGTILKGINTFTMTEPVGYIFADRNKNKGLWKRIRNTCIWKR
jgi:hypothetical protein